MSSENNHCMASVSRLHHGIGVSQQVPSSQTLSVFSLRYSPSALAFTATPRILSSSKDTLPLQKKEEKKNEETKKKIRTKRTKKDEKDMQKTGNGEKDEKEEKRRKK